MMLPFAWTPGAEQRHASRELMPGEVLVSGLNVETLCGKQVTTINGDLEWLWPTWPYCMATACETVDAPNYFPLSDGRDET
ncbi:zinc finger protein [Actinopolyspora sp. H202]|uniref:zinc finger protein n=1 Tax=Actinopolyspora sp. H202 TaxID=1500456 RepID=UPI003EE5DF1A